ncbi:hypothetical protein FD754_020746 [Muntiacus muntjak]|uniref:Uncharacterized protein n=1 Tax=Muntiacus muntjak TaxID=9888 RepID=A0A5N3V5H6_MUNMU|nr:hypothetical protein FD754_020746 [Muntiacus muntjak]
MSQSSQDLVVDFLSYNDVEDNRTKAPEGTEADMEIPSAVNGNLSWYLPSGCSVVVIPVAAVKQMLRELGDKYELRYRWAFSDLATQFHIIPGIVYQNFEHDTFVELWGNNSAAKSRKNQEHFNH